MNPEIESAEKPTDQAVIANSAAATPPVPATRTGSVIAQQGCPTCGAMGPDPSSLNGTVAPGFIYAIGRVEARFPNLAAEKEFAQATGRADTAGQTDQQTFHLSDMLLSRPFAPAEPQRHRLVIGSAARSLRRRCGLLFHCLLDQIYC